MPESGYEPCPFCGGIDLYVLIENISSFGTPMGDYWVVCNGCKARGPQFWGFARQKQGWNRRVASDSDAGVVIGIVSKEIEVGTVTDVGGVLEP